MMLPIMPCISERRPLANTIGAGSITCSRDYPLGGPANNCPRAAADVLAPYNFEKLSFGLLYQLGRYRHRSPLHVAPRFGQWPHPIWRNLRHEQFSVSEDLQSPASIDPGVW